MRNVMRIRPALPWVMSLLLSGAAAAAADLTISTASWSKSRLQVEGTAGAGQVVSLYNAVTNEHLTRIRSQRDGTWELSFRTLVPPCEVRAESGTQIYRRVVGNAPANCVGSPPQPALSSVSLAGPASIAERASAGYTATARFSDGSTRNVTTVSLWSENSSFASFPSPGTLQTTEVSVDQEVTLAASFTSNGVTRSGSLQVRIVNSATSTLSHAGRFSAYSGTGTCLGCHTDQALDFHASVHYQWKGNPQMVANRANDLPVGKMGGINDFCIYPDINWLGKLENKQDHIVVDGGCARCHAGLGLKPNPTPTQAQLENIDCLICHSPDYRRTVQETSPQSGVFRLVPDTAKMTVPLLQAAQNIKKPGKTQCLGCHAFSGGGNNFKRGDLESGHADPPRHLDVHMASRANGGAGLSCLDCHKTNRHRISGRGSDLRPLDYPEFKVACSNCHAQTPHGNANLDKHTKRVDCTTCHIPTFARVASTDMARDWSLPAVFDATKHIFEPAMVHMTNGLPEYRFFNGTSVFYNFGDRAMPSSGGKIVMSAPVGSVNQAGSKIYPFKHHLGVQPQDPSTLQLLPLKIKHVFESGDIVSAIQDGVAGVGWPNHGYRFAETERYMMVSHEVAPKDQALTCNSCHNGGVRLDFDLLGYAPKSTRNEKALCGSCHGDKSGAWSASVFFANVHSKHVTDKRIDCVECHSFSAAQ